MKETYMTTQQLYCCVNKVNKGNKVSTGKIKFRKSCRILKEQCHEDFAVLEMFPKVFCKLSPFFPSDVFPLLLVGTKLTKHFLQLIRFNIQKIV